MRAGGPRRIAWVLYGSLDQRTGGTIYDAQIVDGLRCRGDVVDVLSLPPPARDRRAASALVRTLAAGRPDVIVGDELCFRELEFVLPRTAFAERCLLVHHLTCWEPELRPLERARARQVEARAIRAADRLIVTSRTTKDRLLIEGHRGRVDVVLPGADRLAVTPRSESDGVSFLFVGAIIARKRVRELVRSFATVPRPALLRLAGSRQADVYYAREVERTIAETGCEDRVRLLGEIDEATLGRELGAADALVMPSSLEGYGIAATEAVRAGTPVIAARTPGLLEALGSCPDAARFTDAATLAATLRTFATNRALRLAMRDGARRARLPQWAKAIEQFSALLDLRAARER